MTDRQGEKERRTGRVRQFLRSVRTEMVFSGESLRVNGRGLLFGLIVGLVVGLCGSSIDITDDLQEVVLAEEL